MGNSKSMRQHHQPKSLKSHNINMKPVSELPTEVDWRSSGIVSAVKDQGGCGSCWAFAATATLESHIAKETGLLFSLSPQQIASCSPNPDKCGGTGGCGSGDSLEVETLEHGLLSCEAIVQRVLSAKSIDHARSV